MKTIRARERSTTPLPPDAYHELEDDISFWPLVEQGILSLERTARTRYGLHAGSFVGQAFIGDRLVQVQEKIPGALVALLNLAQAPDARIVTAESFVDAEQAVLRALVDRFLDILDTYLVKGRRKVYHRVRRRGAIPVGKLLVTPTLRRWAEGRRDQVIYERDELTADIFLNRLIGRALNVVDDMMSIEAADAERLRRSRTASLLFEDTNWPLLKHLPLHSIQRQYEVELPSYGDDAQLASLARMFALHFGITTRSTAERIPVSWFINLETLFEEVVRHAVATAAPQYGLRATSWEVSRRYLMSDPPQYQTKPDIVIWKGQTPICILDAKYKDLDGQPSVDDVYQLLCHSSAWGALECGLVFPSSQFEEQPLGPSALGINATVFALDLADPANSIRQMLSKIAVRLDDLIGTAVTAAS